MSVENWGARSKMAPRFVELIFSKQRTRWCRGEGNSGSFLLVINKYLSPHTAYTVCVRPFLPRIPSICGRLKLTDRLYYCQTVVPADCMSQYFVVPSTSYRRACLRTYSWYRKSLKVRRFREIGRLRKKPPRTLTERMTSSAIRLISRY